MAKYDLQIELLERLIHNWYDIKNKITPEDLALYKKYGVSYKNIIKD